jgi:hypothetical protein
VITVILNVLVKKEIRYDLLTQRFELFVSLNELSAILNVGIFNSCTRQILNSLYCFVRLWCLMGMTIHRQILMTVLIGYRNRSIPIVYLNCSPKLKLRTLLSGLNWRHFGV